MRRWDRLSSSALARRGPLVLLCAGVLLACGCDGAKDTDTPGAVVIWEADKEQWVRLEPRDDAGAPLNEHPAQLAPAQIAGALSSLSMVEEDSTEPIFTSAEATQLGEAVARALAQARPDQDVTFRSVGSRPLTSGKVLKGVSVSSGRLFQQEGKLNLIFGDVLAKSKTRTVYGQREEFADPRPAARSVSADHEWEVIAPEGVERRDDWFAFDATQLTALSAPAAASATTPDTTGGGAPAAQAGAPPASSAPAATAAAPPAPSSPAAQAAAPPAPATHAAPPATPPAPAPALSPEADMERRLRTLKDLREKGLITEEAYRAKIEEILSVL